MSVYVIITSNDKILVAFGKLKFRLMVSVCVSMSLGGATVSNAFQHFSTMTDYTAQYGAVFVYFSDSYCE